MKIAISGAGGYIGKEVVAHALNQGHAVVALVRDQYPREWDELENLVVKPCDLLEGAAALDNVLPGCDALIHLAAIMNGNDQYTKTIEATKNVLDAMDRAEVKRLVNVSSIAVLDYVRQLPMSTIDEMVPPASSDQDLGCYALMKRDQEELCKSWRGGGKTLIQLRPGIVYDPRSLSRVFWEKLNSGPSGSAC